MQITKLELKNFKRFTDLTIEGIPAETKLVLLIGSNGSGKSSVFDAFEVANSLSRQNQYSEAFLKQEDLLFKIRLEFPEAGLSAQSAFVLDNNTISIAPTNTSVIPLNGFYGRTSLRQIPRLTRTQLGHLVSFETDGDRPRLFIDRDERFENDLERIYEQILKDIFRSETSSREVKATYINPINEALDNIFGHQPNTRLSLIEIIPPLEGKIAQITFRKGKSEIHYNYLSAGEKEVINILFNLLVRREQFVDTVYFLDELDLHLNTALQFNLIKEITENWIPAKCQLWTASHSLGFIDYAHQYEQGVIIDFDDLDFDQPQTLSPQPKERLDIYDIAVPKETLLKIMSGKQIVICENQNDEYYNLIALPDTLFVGVKDSRDVFLHVKREPQYHSLRDRDFLSDTEIDRIQKLYPNHHILAYYNFENYIYHPDNLAELQLPGFDRQAYANEIIRQKIERTKYILASIVSSRQTYEEFKTEPKLKDQSGDSIVDDLDSADFGRFYAFFDMKKQFKKDKGLLGFIMPDHKKLVQTSWFSRQIAAILSNNK